ncbi:hypothetical protein PsYK624_171540 [Phanerochaete sordida]|uniref:Uncharacterized protein n=1 Tax=Phanerochaete sordida TaxID=48140 RepID=A0A9P3GT42_9APHY|nr:hypothetical protein PsYK624_171540 [Phanerochaete sordida]
MINALQNHVKLFSETANRRRCFAHIVNLCAKSVLQPFDVETKKKDEMLDKAEQILQELAEGLELENHGGDQYLGLDKEEDRKDDSANGLVNELLALAEAEQADLLKKVYPTKMILVKVSSTCWLSRTPHP